jgi:hypothetical protein
MGLQQNTLLQTIATFSPCHYFLHQGHIFLKIKPLRYHFNLRSCWCLWKRIISLYNLSSLEDKPLLFIWKMMIISSGCYENKLSCTYFVLTLMPVCKCRHFVPNLTIGAPVIQSLRKHTKYGLYFLCLYGWLLFLCIPSNANHCFFLEHIWTAILWSQTLQIM